MESLEQKRIAKSRRGGNQGETVEALFEDAAPILRVNKLFHHQPMK
jgi:hypothetical protein